MILEITIALLLGVISGTLTGITPGVHINLVSAGVLALSSAAFISKFPPITLVVFLVAAVGPVR